MSHDEAAVNKFNAKIIELKEHSTSSYTKSLSGALFLSGGNLMFQGDSTLTEVASA